MIERIVRYFAERRILGNLMFFGIMIGAVLFLGQLKKEDMPNIVMDFVSISTSYPGASPEEVEYFVTREIEDRVKGIDGVGKVNSTSAAGSSSIRVELLPEADRETVINEIRTAVSDARLPDEVLDDPYVREFKASMRSIISIGLFLKDEHLLNDEKRRELQKYSLLLEEGILNLKEINSVRRGFYRDPEINIEAHPEKMREYNIPLSKIMSEVSSANVRIPAGSLEDDLESRVTLASELDTADKLKQVIVQAGFEGQKVRLDGIADIRETFKREKTIQKINGREGVQLTVVKNAASGILDSTDAVNGYLKKFMDSVLKNTNIEAIALNDNSYDVRNRLSIIYSNGAIGMTLVLVSLLLVLNRRTAFWVAMGIPFTFAFTVVLSYAFGYTINNITLAAIIIVMGMIVDDAIIVAENISRTRSQGVEFSEAAVKGTTYVIKPVFAGVITTCIAFIPFFMFEGRFGKMLDYLPPVVFMMLGASLFESLLILPGHMNMHAPKWALNLMLRFKGSSKPKKQKEERAKHWFIDVEEVYGRFLEKMLNKKYLLFAGAFVLLAGAFWVMNSKMKFVMFPNEETRSIDIVGEAKPGTLSPETAALTVKIEEVLSKYLGKEVIGYRTEIARSRWRAAEEHKFRMSIEVVPKEKRKKSVNQLISGWEKEFEPFRGDFVKLNFSKGWFGQDSGTPIVIQVRENNDKTRAQACEMILAALKEMDDLENQEIDKVVMTPEFTMEIDRERAARLGVTADSVRRTLRAAVEGAILYEIKGETETIRVRATIPPGSKKDIQSILSMPVENRGNYLVPLRNVVKTEKTRTPAQIEREDFKRITNVYSGIKPKSGRTPLDVASELEEKVFPAVLEKFSSVGIAFDGEVRDSRESGRNFLAAIVITIGLIYIVLTLLFNSFTKPFIIMFTMPFGIVGVIIAFLVHGKFVFGFFSVIGVIGLLGVVINNSIVMLVKLDREYDKCHHREMSDKQIANIAKTRLQAVLLTTVTTVAALFPTAYGVAGFDAMLAEMMLAMGWGLLFGTVITLVLVPCVYGAVRDFQHHLKHKEAGENKCVE